MDLTPYQKLLNESKFIVIQNAVDDPIELIRGGLSPILQESECLITYGTITFNNIDFTKLVIEDIIINKFTIDELKFWYQRDPYSILKEITEWYYAKLDYYKGEALIFGESLWLMIFAPDLDLIYSSGRPKTDMLSFRITNYQPPNDINGYLSYPVSRYGAGFEQGMYYVDDEENNNCDYCGTFYYLEPESTTYLLFKSYKTFKNKFEAARYLLNFTTVGNMYIFRYQDLEQEFYLNESARRHFVHHAYNADLLYTPLEALRSFPDLFTETEEEVAKLPQRKRYLGQFLGLYALEDDLDQIICLAAKEKNIDLIIFDEMIGSHQIVTEILDTRDRTISFNHLIYNYS